VWIEHNGTDARLGEELVAAGIPRNDIVIEAVVGQLSPLRLVFAWANSDQVPFLLGQFNFFQAFDVCFFRSRGVFEIRQPGTSSAP
jgi:hypothetical protein